MNKIVRLTESELRDKIKNLIIERLGVPDNILETAENVFNMIVRVLERLQEAHGGRIPNKEYDVKVEGNFRISDFNFDGIHLRIKYDSFPPGVVDLNKTEVLGMGSGHGVDMDPKTLKITYTHDENEIYIQVAFVYPEGLTTAIEDSLRLIKSDPQTYTATVAHELLHAYSGRKGPYTTNAARETEYQAVATGIGMAGFPSINKISEGLYYFSHPEILTRPTQIASAMRTQRTTKAQFLDFLRNNKVYQRLLEFKNYTFEDFKKQLYEDIFSKPEIRNELSGLNEEERIQKMFSMAYMHITNKKITVFKNFVMSEIGRKAIASLQNADFEAFVMMATGAYEQMANAHIQKYIKRSYRYEKNPAVFFENTIKMLNFAANELIKKVSKLYDMAKDDNIQPDIHTRINKKTKLETNPKVFNENDKVTTADILKAGKKAPKIYYKK